MNQVNHIVSHKKDLDQRFAIIRAVREWFWEEGFIEVETPLILRLPGQEPHLSLMKTEIYNEKGEVFPAYLHTSPEYALKKMLAAGYTKIFSLGKVFRNHESFGGTHNPEFTMIEWYRANKDFNALIDDVEGLLDYVAEKTKLSIDWKFQRFHMRELWQKFANVNLDDYLDKESMLRLCREKGHGPLESEGYEDLFYRIFLNEIEPKLASLGVVAVHHYPMPMASLSRQSETDPGYAERVEIYVDGIELANGFSELTDGQEQLKRLQAEQKQRAELGREVYDIDMEFIDAVNAMPKSAGIALGIDRLVMALTGCQNINDVLVLPASELFSEPQK